MRDVAEQAEQRRQRFEALAGEVTEPVRRFLARRTGAADAEDALAETLLACWRRLEDVPEDNPLPWVYAAARHCLANVERSRRRQERVAGKIVSLDPPVDHVPDLPGDPALAEALAELSAEERELVRLWGWEQLEPRELATVLGISANAAANRLSRLRAKLRDRRRQDPGGAGHEGSTGGRP
ncbi:MAG: sigma-70 family RNA polymerase sigma factor [Nocardioides sp.]